MSAMAPRHWVIFGLLGLVWGSGFLWNKLALVEMRPLSLVATRLALAAVVDEDAAHPHKAGPRCGA